jgi:hypothetical protein
MTLAHVHHNAPPRGRLLWRYLWLWAMLMLLAVWGILAAVSHYTGMHEADEINDGQLVAVSQILLRQENLSSKALHAEPANPQQYPLVYAPELRAIAWENGQVVWDSHGIAAWMPAQLRLGLQTLKPQASPVQWRAYVSETTASDGTTRRVVVLIDKTWRQALGRDIAIHLGWRPSSSSRTMWQRWIWMPGTVCRPSSLSRNFPAPCTPSMRSRHACNRSWNASASSLPTWRMSCARP